MSNKIQQLLSNRDSILNTITAYCNANKRPCPRSHIYSVHGEIDETLKLLATNEDIIGSRGRNGGFMVTAEAERIKSSIKDAAKDRIKAKLASKKAAAKTNEADPFPAVETAPAATNEVVFGDDNTNTVDETVERIRAAVADEDAKQEDSSEDDEFAAMMREIASGISPNAHFNG
jgi:hypothetical protein